MKSSAPWLLALALGSVGYAQPGPEAGYLAAGALDLIAVVEPAPLPGDPRYEADRAIFRATRGLAGSPRYALATSDAETRPSALLHDFSCAVGLALTPDNAPRLTAVAQRAARDSLAQAGRAKDLYRHERPYVIDPGPTCQAPADLLDARTGRASYDYPSGHATLGWTWALVLAAAAPDRAQQVLERGRAYSESRVVCGVHNHSAVEAGIVTASATMALVQASPAYQSDLAAARAELAALRQGGTEAPVGCEAEVRLLEQPLLPPQPAGAR